ncbi:MAG: hypothetical protein OEY89_09045 [Gammaproteobacteria bacterium]|nr:hypothetical protein [Gammaproteobacteria bacterium]
MKLIFVYNADSGLFNTVTDIAHKILSPKTYSCHLCALTHSYFSVRDNWVKFLEKLAIECEFLHRDEFQEKYRVLVTDLPVIYISHTDQLEMLLDKAEIDSHQTLDSLKAAINQKLGQ